MFSITERGDWRTANTRYDRFVFAAACHTWREQEGSGLATRPNWDNEITIFTMANEHGRRSNERFHEILRSSAASVVASLPVQIDQMAEWRLDTMSQFWTFRFYCFAICIDLSQSYCPCPFFSSFSVKLFPPTDSFLSAFSTNFSSSLLLSILNLILLRP